MPVPEGAVHYLEIVTPDVEAARDVCENAHRWDFGPPVPELGNAHVASLPDGSLCGIRAPMHEQEQPVVRPYVRVSDIEDAVERAVRSGATQALEPTEIPGRGRIAIVLYGGVHHGLWELP